MEAVDEDNVHNYGSDASMLSDVVEKSFSVPGFLRKVFMEELSNDSGRDHKLIVTAVHAVMLESGFVAFDQKNSNVAVNGSQFRPDVWPSRFFNVSLFYTLPEAIKTVVLKFQSLGKFINVYGTLGNGSGDNGTYCVQLNEDQLVPFLNVVWANCGAMEKEMFKFWRTVKDDLALPLLIDLCEESGLQRPACFMRLPTDLKLKIMESLPGLDVAKLSCVCSELRCLGSSEDLWKYREHMRSIIQLLEWDEGANQSIAVPKAPEDINGDDSDHTLEWKVEHPYTKSRKRKILWRVRGFLE